MGRNHQGAEDADAPRKVKITIPAGIVKKAAAKKTPSKASAVKKAAPVKAATKKMVVVGNSIALAATCKTSGCGEQGQRKTFRVPSTGSIALMPGGVVCLGCGKLMQFDPGDVYVERVER